MNPPVTLPIDRGLALVVCPVCGGSFERSERTLHCASGHRFDLARQGYVNLLRAAPPANADTTEMVAARERLLASGCYSPIREAMARECLGAGSIVEVGAGTGYYLAGALNEVHPASHAALDVSVAAARRSARAGLASAVADTWQGLPIADRAVDRLLCVFAPRNATEFARVLSPRGRAVVVTPNPEHLAALRESLDLLEVPHDKLERLDASFEAAGLSLAGREKVRFDAELGREEASDLVAMGPNAFHRTGTGVRSAISVHVDVSVSSYTLP